jgi:hypothetical protein
MNKGLSHTRSNNISCTVRHVRHNLLISRSASADTCERSSDMIAQTCARDALELELEIKYWLRKGLYQGVEQSCQNDID